jgi:hypothetical protein
MVNLLELTGRALAAAGSRGRSAAREVRSVRSEERFGCILPVLAHDADGITNEIALVQVALPVPQQLQMCECCSAAKGSRRRHVPASEQARSLHFRCISSYGTDP